MRAVARGASYTLLERVVDAAIPSHADWAIQICRQQAEPIMQQGQSQHYHHAARWLRRPGQPIALPVARRSGRPIWRS